MKIFVVILMLLLAGCAMTRDCPDQMLLLPSPMGPIPIPRGWLNPMQTDHYWTCPEVLEKTGVDVCEIFRQAMEQHEEKQKGQRL